MISLQINGIHHIKATVCVHMGHRKTALLSILTKKCWLPPNVYYVLYHAVVIKISCHSTELNHRVTPVSRQSTLMLTVATTAVLTVSPSDF